MNTLQRRIQVIQPRTSAIFHPQASAIAAKIEYQPRGRIRASICSGRNEIRPVTASASRYGTNAAQTTKSAKPAGWVWIERAIWKCAAIDHDVVMPQKGHGKPVIQRNVHGGR